MSKIFRLFILLFFISFQNIIAQNAVPPVTKKVPKVFSEHGGERTDNYFWLNNYADSNVINHLKEENAYVETYMKHTEGLQKKLYNEIVARIPGRDESLPVKQNGYWYYTRFEEGNQYPYYARKKDIVKAPEEITLDVPEMAKNYQIYLVRGWDVSKNSQQMAYGIDTAGDRRSTLFFKNLATGKLMPESITNTSGNYEWFNDNKTLYYVLNDNTVRPYKVMRHTLGTDVSTDKEIYTEKDSTYDVYVTKSRNNKYIFIVSSSTNTKEQWYIDANRPDSTPAVIQPRQNNLEYRADYYEGNVFHIYTNLNATNFKYVTAPISKSSVENWKDVIAANDKSYLERVEVLKNYYIAQTKENGLPQIKIYSRKNKTWNNVNFGEEDYVADFYLATDDYNIDSIRYYFTSLSTPGSEYLYNVSTGEKRLLKRQKVGGNFNADLYEIKRLWSTSSDGVKVPVSIVYRKDKFKKDGNNPLLLYAYGSYGYSTDPDFNSSIISLLDRGVLFAIAHIRGGQEMGREWFEQGRILHKKIRLLILQMPPGF